MKRLLEIGVGLICLAGVETPLLAAARAAPPADRALMASDWRAGSVSDRSRADSGRSRSRLADAERVSPR